MYQVNKELNSVKVFEKIIEFSLPDGGLACNKVSCLLWSGSEPQLCIVGMDGSVSMWSVIKANKEAIKCLGNGALGEPANCICRRAISQSDEADQEQTNTEAGRGPDKLSPPANDAGMKKIVEYLF
ncbi:unnamed protein product [Gongylonema pulchrum]|uniref:WD_REPEATS_REGION domain-containing protein n=1 Tax=Gongylonema pulchrum TaxID=637853 RepID=A0A183ELR7_9BILA|nr:unnamed protein product [Gongylonema pulchrum]